MPIPSINTTNSVSHRVHSSAEQLSDMNILRQPVLINHPNSNTLYQQKMDIFDKLIRECPNNTILDLINIELANQNLSGRELHQIQFLHAKLNGINLSDAYVVDCDFGNAKLNNAKMDRTKFENTRLDKAEMNGAGLVDADLSRANLYKTKMIQADLTNACLNFADLVRADFTNADLSNAKLIGVYLAGANFTGAVLDGVELRNIAFPEWNDEYLLDYFNPVLPDYFSIQETIDSIDPKYNDQKIVLMHELLDFLDRCAPNISLSSVEKPLLDILLKTPYNQDEKITNWIKNNLGLNVVRLWANR